MTGTPKNKTFSWQVAHGRILTNVERMARGFAQHDICPRCIAYPETLMHALRDCDEVQAFWSKAVSHEAWSSFFSLGLHAWLEFNMSGSHASHSEWHWPLFFGVTI